MIHTPGAQVQARSKMIDLRGDSAGGYRAYRRVQRGYGAPRAAQVSCEPRTYADQAVDDVARRDEHGPALSLEREAEQIA
jgi:hypothetical protein